MQRRDFLQKERQKVGKKNKRQKVVKNKYTLKAIKSHIL